MKRCRTCQESCLSSARPLPARECQQTIDTILGRFYTFSFWTSSNGGPYLGGLLVGWNGATIGIVNTPAQGTWERHAYTVVGTGGPTLFSLSTLIDTNQGPLVDRSEEHTSELQS